MTTESSPQNCIFTAALTDDQVKKACSTTDAAAITMRMLIASLKLDSAGLNEAWTSAPDAFMELLENAPVAIDKLKAVVELTEAAQARLLLTGASVFNPLGDDEDDEDDEVRNLVPPFTN